MKRIRKFSGVALLFLLASCGRRADVPVPARAPAVCSCDTAFIGYPPPPPPPPDARLGADSVPVEIRGAATTLRAVLYAERADVDVAGTPHALIRVEASNRYSTRSFHFLDPGPPGCIDSLGLRAGTDMLYIGHRVAGGFCTLYALWIDDRYYERFRREDSTRSWEDLARGLIGISPRPGRLPGK